MNHARRNILHISTLFIFSLLLLCLQNAHPQERSPADVIAGAIHHQNLGLAYLEESHPNKAAEEFRALMDLLPNEAIGYGNLAVAHLRLKNSDAAEAWVKRGLEVQPMDSQLHFILSEIYQWQGKSEEAVAEMNEAVKLDPEDLGARYKLVRHYLGMRDDQEATKHAISHLQTLRDQTPTNAVVRLKLAQALLQLEWIEEAKQIGAELTALFRDVKEDALKYLNQGLHLLEQGDSKGAKKYIRIFENIQKATPRYQQGIGELVTDILGHPIENFSKGFKSRVKAKLSPPIDVRFVDVTEEVGLRELKGKHIKVILLDNDKDGDLDLYPLLSPDTEGDTHSSLQNEDGKFEADFGANGGDAAAYADIRKTGRPQLHIKSVAVETPVYNENGESEQRIFYPTRAELFFVDYDHDGDLDRFFVADIGGAGVTVDRNNGDGEFAEVTAETFVPSDPPPAIDAGFGDFDDDGDIDLVIVHSTAGCTIYDNQRQGRMKAVTDETGIPQNQSFSAVAVADYNNDGALDIFLAGAGTTPHRLYRNRGDGTFSRDNRSDEVFAAAKALHGQDAHFFDFDNDGFLDLLLIGSQTQPKSGGVHPHGRYAYVSDFDSDGFLDLFQAGSSAEAGARSAHEYARDSHVSDFDNDGFLDLFLVGDSVEAEAPGVRLYRNDGTGRYSEVSDILPTSLSSGVDGAVGDYDNDGDLDLFLVDGNGRVVALRNDGGNRNSWLQVRLEAVTTGNNKVNIDGIGSKVEVKIGDLYQMKYTTEPTSHFGLGSAERADVLRVVWTNGVPQNVIKPEANQRIVEKQVLKGSCPFLYVYDGERYRFVTDLLWRSPLGMITSIGSIAPDQTEDYVKIPDFMAPKNGVYSLQITEELWETAYFDLVKLMAVDRPAGTEIFVDERYALPPYSPFKIHTVKEKRQPQSAFDHLGNDVSEALKEFDYRYAVEHEPGEYQGVVAPHAIIP